MRLKRKVVEGLTGLVVTLFFLFVTFTGGFDLTKPLETKAFDWMAGMAASQERNPHIELVVISDEDLSRLGPFPWPRDILAQAVRNLSLAGAKVIALDIPLGAPEEGPGLKLLRNLKERYESLGLGQEGAGLTFFKALSDAESDLDNDAKLSRAIEKAGNVVLSASFDAEGRDRDETCPDYIARYSIKRIQGAGRTPDAPSLPWFFRLRPLLPALAEVAAGIGHRNLLPDRDGYIRHRAPVVGYLKDFYFPSLSLAIVKVFKGVQDKDITLTLGKDIVMRTGSSSVINIPMSGPVKTLIHWGRGQGASFHRTSFFKVFKNQLQTSLFRDKVVILGPSARRLDDRFETPISDALPGVEIVANSVANILNQEYFSRPGWLLVAEYGTMAIFGLFVILGLPRIRRGPALLLTLTLLLAYGVGVGALFWGPHILIRIMPAMLLLVVGCILILTVRLFSAEGEYVKEPEIPAHILKERGIVEAGPEEAATVILGANGTMEHPSTLGHYRLLGEIGRGTMGVVYKGEDFKIHRTVAIKTVNMSELEEDMIEEVRARFFQEAESAGRLTHPSIVTIYDFGEEKGLAYMAMEYLIGESLERFTKAGQLLPLRDTLDTVARVADALDYAHQKDIVHRDIKPANIMRLRDTKQVKVTDFGVARIMTSSRTRTGVVLGTPSYMSPEQVSGKKVDGRSDIFSLGVVLFEMLTGRKPFEAQDVTSLMFKIAKERHPSPRTINPRTPRVVERIMDKALEKSLDRRYQRASHLAGHLKKVVERIDEIQAQRRSRSKS